MKRMRREFLIRQKNSVNEMGIPHSLYGSAFPSEKGDQDHLKGCYELLENGILLCRAALYLNPGHSLNGKQASCAGNFESVDDEEAASFLLDHLASESRKLGAGYITGPMNGSTWFSYRFCENDPLSPFFLEPFHPPYYPALFRASGFVPVAEYISSLEPLEGHLPSRHFPKSPVTVRPVNISRFEEELEDLHGLIHQSFSANLLFTPVSASVFVDLYSGLKNSLDPDLILIAEDQEGKKRGFVFAVPDLYNPARKRMIIKTLARDPGPRFRGLGAHLAFQVISAGKSKGYREVIHALMHADNSSINLSSRFQGAVLKKYTLFGKDLEGY